MGVAVFACTEEKLPVKEKKPAAKKPAAKKAEPKTDAKKEAAKTCFKNRDVLRKHEVFSHGCRLSELAAQINENIENVTQQISRTQEYHG